MVSRFIKCSQGTVDGVRVTHDGMWVVVRVEDSNHAIPVSLTAEQARELANVLEAFAVVVSHQSSEVLP